MIYFQCLTNHNANNEFKMLSWWILSLILLIIDNLNNFQIDVSSADSTADQKTIHSQSMTKKKQEIHKKNHQLRSC